MAKFQKPSKYEIKRLRTLADFQFGNKAGDIVCPDEIMIEKSKGTKRIRFVYLNGERIFSFRVRDGYLVPSMLGARILFENNLGLKIKVDNEAEPFVRKGKTVFAKYVLEADQKIQVKEEVLITNEKGDLIGIGTAKLPGRRMTEMNIGVAVDTRKGIKLEEN